MATPDLATSRRPCGLHPDRVAVAVCTSCGRPACLGCAIPVRGRVLCAECAARELGQPAPVAVPRRLSSRPEVAVGLLLLLALGATVPPWDRFGALTGVLSAWRPSPDPWALVACLALLGATAVVAAHSTFGRVAARLLAGGYAALATVAALATAGAVFGAPDYVSHTPAPYVALAAATAAAVVGYARLPRLPALRGTARAS